MGILPFSHAGELSEEARSDASRPRLRLLAAAGVYRHVAVGS
jgi:hypothetical protein